MNADETRREKARNLRYKRPIVRNLNLDTIRSELWDIQEECEEVHWYCDTDEETLINALDGEEDEAYEFKMMFCDLCAECEQMSEDLAQDWVPDCFDRFFVAIGAGDNGGGLLGYDSYEGDYYGLEYGFLDEAAEKESQKKLKAMTKDELIAAAGQCFRVYQSFISLRYRYDCLKASLDLLRGQNTGYLQVVKQIEECYERADRASAGFRFDSGKEIHELNRLLENMPPEAWIQ